MTDMKDKTKGTIDNVADRAKNVTDSMSAGAQGAKNTGTGVVNTMREGAQSAANAVSDFASDAKGKVQEWTSDVTDTARQVGDKAQEWAGQAYDSTTETMKSFGNEMTSMVRRYPIPAVLVGFGLGLLIGRAVRTTSI